jgi:ABC-type multidrug transport system fused ATPase/permease subunit
MMDNNFSQLPLDSRNSLILKENVPPGEMLHNGEPANNIFFPKYNRKLDDVKPKPFEALYDFVVPKRPLNEPKNFFKRFFLTNMNFCFWNDPNAQNKLQPRDFNEVTTPNQIATYIDNLKKRSVFGCLLLCKSQYVYSIIYTTLSGLVMLTIPLITKEFLNEHKKLWNQKPGQRSVLILVLLVVALVATFLLRLYFLNKGIFYRRPGVTAKALRVMIFDKLLDLNLIHHGHFVDTTLINLITSDVDNIFACIGIVPNFISAIINLGLQFYLINTFNIYMLALPAFLILFTLMLVWITKRIRNQLANMQRANDSITKTLKELAESIEYVKSFSLEYFFYKVFMSKKEYQSSLTKRYIGWAQAAEVLGSVSPNILGLIYFGIEILKAKKGNDDSDDSEGVSLGQTFAILTVISIMRGPITSIKDAFLLYPIFAVSKSRIEFFVQKTLEKSKQSIQSSGLEKGTVQFVDATVAFPSPCNGVGLTKSYKSSYSSLFKKETPQLHQPSTNLSEHRPLKNIKATISKGAKVAIVGAPSAGKTTFLLSILGETELVNGSINVNGETCYLSEQPFMIEDSIYQNIVMGKPHDKDRYDLVLEVSGLKALLTDMDEGDSMVLKDDAVNISKKTQKLICLARALYRDYDIYLIDQFFDDYSKLEVQEALRTIFSTVLCDKTVISTTRQIESCREYDLIIVMNEGRIVQTGTFYDLMNNKQGIFNAMFFLKSHEESQYEIERNEPQFEEIDLRHNNSMNQSIEEALEKDTLLYPWPAQSAFPALENTQSLAKMVLTRYFCSLGLLLPMVYVILLFLSQGCVLGFTIFTTIWKFDLIEKFSPSEYLYSFILLSVAILILDISRRVFRIIYFRRISFNLFDEIVKGLLSKTLTSFKETSLASKMATLVTGYDDIDEQAGNGTSNLMISLMFTTLAVGLICYKSYLSCGPIILLFIVIMMIFYRLMNSQNSLKMTIIKVRTCLLNSLIDTHRGLLCFRNSGHIDFLRKDNMILNDAYVNILYTDGNVQQRWIASRISCLAMLFPVFLMTDMILNIVFNWNPEFILNGAKFSIAIDICLAFSTIVPSFISHETFMSQVMDIMNNNDNLIACDRLPETRVKSLTRSITKPPERGYFWMKRPSESRRTSVSPELSQLAFTIRKTIDSTLIEMSQLTYFHHHVMRPALRNVNLIIKRGDFVGVVGEYGSGKHTLIRILAGLESSKGIAQGFVKINDIIINKETQERSHEDVMYISEDCCMFEGTIRSNIDPLSKYPEKLIIELFDYLGFWELMLHHEGSMGVYNTLMIDPVNKRRGNDQLQLNNADLSIKMYSDVRADKDEEAAGSERGIDMDPEINDICVNNEAKLKVDCITSKIKLPRTNSLGSLFHEDAKKNKKLKQDQVLPFNRDGLSERSIADSRLDGILAKKIDKVVKIKEMRRYLLRKRTSFFDNEWKNAANAKSKATTSKKVSLNEMTSNLPNQKSIKGVSSKNKTATDLKSSTNHQSRKYNVT